MKGLTLEDGILGIVVELERKYGHPPTLANIQVEAVKQDQVHPHDTESALESLEEDEFVEQRDGGWARVWGAA